MSNYFMISETTYILVIVLSMATGFVAGYGIGWVNRGDKEEKLREKIERGHW